MSLLVTGSIGVDTVETPAGRRDGVIGGSAVYFSYAASFFAPVRLVGVVGEDAPRELFNVFDGRDVDAGGLEVRKGSKTFRWHGSYLKNLNEAARDVLKMGPKFVVIKKGEHGCLMVSERGTFVLPAYPADKVVDPTGAGDSFAGGMMGYLATQGNFSPATIKRALAFGTVVASHTIADFSLAALQAIDRDQIDERWHEYKQAMSF